MNTQILQENLLKALARAGRIVSPRPQLPVLQNIKLSAKKDGLVITATNLESSETIWVGGKVQKEGELCVPARIFTELVTSLTPQTVHLMVKDGSLHVSCESTTATIPGTPAAEFPPVPAVLDKDMAKTGKDVFVKALSSVLFSSATDEGRPVLTGVKMKVDGAQTLFAATDGYRLSTKHITLPLEKFADSVIPARTLAEVVKIANEEKEEDSIMMGKAGDNQVAFVVGDTTISTRLLDGEYPSFERIIPKSFTTRAVVDKDHLLRAVRSAAIFAKDNANIIKMTLDKQKIRISANAPQVGESTVELEAKIDGDGGEIAFNSRFLIDILNNFSEPELLFEMTGALNPGVFRPVKDESYLHIIMPVRVSGA